MNHQGLVARKIKRRGQGLATYWVRPEQLARLKAAKRGNFRQESEEDRVARVNEEFNKEEA